MSKREDVQRELKSLVTRIERFEETQIRMKRFEGLNDGTFAVQNDYRLKIAQEELEQFKEDNLEYIL